MGFHKDLLAHSYAMFLDALSPEGRAGLRLLRTHEEPRAPDATPVPPLSPAERLDALARHGLDTPASRWLAAALLARHPDLAARLPKWIAEAAPGDEALALLRLAGGTRDLAAEALSAALARGGLRRAELLALAADLPDAVRPLLERVLVSDESAGARAAAALALAHFLPDGEPAVAQALRADREPLVRSAAAAALAKGDARAVVSLSDAAKNERDPAVCLSIVASLRRLGGPAAAEALLNLAESRDAKAAAAALRALGDIGYCGADRRVLALLRSGVPEVQAEAARLLALAATPEAARALLAAARREPTGPLVQAAGGFEFDDAESILDGWLDHADAAVRLAAAEALARHDALTPRARGVLRKLLEDGTPPEVQDPAALRLINAHDDAAVPALLRLLEGERLRSATRLAFVRVAGERRWQPAGPMLVQTLWRGLAESGRLDRPEERDLWLAALDAAPGVGPVWNAEIQRIVPPTPKNCLHAPELDALRTGGLAGFLRALWFAPLPDEPRRRAVASYARLRGADAVPELLALLESPVLQGAAARALGSLKPAALTAALRSPSARARSAAAAALGALGDPIAVAALQPLLADADAPTRLEAAYALAAITRRPVEYTDYMGEKREAKP